MEDIVTKYQRGFSGRPGHPGHPSLVAADRRGVDTGKCLAIASVEPDGDDILFPSRRFSQPQKLRAVSGESPIFRSRRKLPGQRSSACVQGNFDLLIPQGDEIERQGRADEQSRHQSHEQHAPFDIREFQERFRFQI